MNEISKIYELLRELPREKAEEARAEIRELLRKNRTETSSDRMSRIRSERTGKIRLIHGRQSQ